MRKKDNIFIHIYLAVFGSYFCAEQLFLDR